MQKELIISTTSQETKIAILEDNDLVEFYIERHRSQGIVGNIYKGRVTKVLPGMQSAFVDIGLERDAFLYVSDFLEDVEEYEKMVATAEDEAVKFTESPARGVGPAASLASVPSVPSVPVPPVAPIAVVATVPNVDVPSLSRPQPAASAPREDFEQGRRRRERDRDRDRGRDRDRDRRGKRPRIPSFEPAMEARPERPPVVDDRSYLPLEVLPGESLAKYSTRRPAEVLDRLDRVPTGDLNDAGPASEPEAAPEMPQVPLETAAGPEPVMAAPPTVEMAAPQPEEVSAVPSSAELTMTVDGTTVDHVQEPPSEPEIVSADENGEDTDDGSAGETAPEEQPNGPAGESSEDAGRATARMNSRGDQFQVNQRQGGRRPRGRRGPPPEAREEARPAASGPRSAPTISELLREGQEILVQVAKEPLGKKGARITSHIALPGRFVVYMPTVDHVGVSRKIGSDEERSRLRRFIQEHRVGLPGGFIVRTAGEGQSEQEFVQDVKFLGRLWADIKARGEKKSGAALIHRELSPVQKMLRDQLSPDFKSIRLDNEMEFATVLEFVNRFQPALVNRVKLHLKDTPIFEEFGLAPEIEKALRPKVWLKSGGYIVVNQTEALVAIDVNTGKYVGRSNRLEDTIVRTNVEAAQEVVRQMRLRNLGGIIVVDFIDMEERKNRQKIMGALEEALRADRVPSKILQFNDFGLVAITRKRTQPSLERTLCSPCPQCSGAGWVKSVETVCYDILQDLRKMASVLSGNEVTIRVNPAVAKALKTGEFVTLQEMEEWARKEVVIKSDPLLHQEHFDIF